MNKQSFHDQFAVLFLHSSDRALRSTIGMLDGVIDREDLMSFALTSQEKPEVVWSRVRETVEELQEEGKLPIIIAHLELLMNEITPELDSIISDFPQGGILLTEVPFLRGWDTFTSEQKNWHTGFFNGHNLIERCEAFLSKGEDTGEFKNV